MRRTTARNCPSVAAPTISRRPSSVASISASDSAVTVCTEAPAAVSASAQASTGTRGAPQPPSSVSNTTSYTGGPPADLHGQR
jgi:hypothetical protein